MISRLIFARSKHFCRAYLLYLFGIGTQLLGKECHFCHFLKRYGVFNRLSGGLSPGEYTVVLNEYCGYRLCIRYRLGYNLSRIPLIRLVYFFVREVASARDVAVEGIGVSCAVCSYLSSALCK